MWRENGKQEDQALREIYLFIFIGDVHEEDERYNEVLLGKDRDEVNGVMEGGMEEAH